MTKRNKVALLFMALIVGLAVTIDPALAHRFNVALIIPLSGAASVQGGEFRKGFMLATAERDAHPGQESDGHLGGLDVYVKVIDVKGDVAADLMRSVTQGPLDIVVIFGSKAAQVQIKKVLEGKNVALLLPGQPPFSRSDLPGVAVFVSTFAKKYGTRPSSHAAQGYNAARRIDIAVRSQSEVRDTASLLRSFRATARDFTW